MSSSARSALPGSEAQPPPGAQIIGPVNANQPIEVSVLVRPRQPLESLEQRLNQSQLSLSREEFAAAYGTDPANLAKIEAFARQHGLEVVEASPARRTIRLSGRARDIAHAFGVQLMRYRLPDRTTFRSYAGTISVPTDLLGVVQGVFGLDDRPLARARGSDGRPIVQA